MAPNAGEAVGAVLTGQWKLIRLIGEGGLAAVYEAESLSGKGRRAIKLLHPQYVANRAVVERFYAEAKAVYALRHPHIAVVEGYDYAEDGSSYIVMELLEGVSLEDYLQRNQPMAVEVAAPIMHGILQALSVAHAHGIIHRDLKPPNLFLVPEGPGRYTVKVLDFGIAKVMDVAGGMGSKTRTGAVLGTPGYMSPEQVKNAKGVDVRSDVWAAGVVFYEMLTCHHPFGSSDDLARMVAVLKQPPAPISSVAPHLSAWEHFFARALAREPAQRFQSVEEMAQQLAAMARSVGVELHSERQQTVSMAQMPDMTTTGALSAAPAMSVPPSTALRLTGGTLASEAQPQQTTESMAAVPHPSAPPQAAAPQAATGGYDPAAYRPAGSTQVSAEHALGAATYHSNVPQVNVVEAADEEPPSLVWWAVVLIGLGCFALGLAVGYVLAS